MNDRACMSNLHKGHDVCGCFFIYTFTYDDVNDDDKILFLFAP